MAGFDGRDRTPYTEDLLLLSGGHIHLVRRDWALQRLVDDLSAVGYPAVHADIGGCLNGESLRAAVIAAVPEWPHGYGLGSWLGFRDGLSDFLLSDRVRRRLLVLHGFDQLFGFDHGQAVMLLDLLAGFGHRHLLFGRRLICLVRTDDADLDLPRLGGAQPRWNRHEQHFDERA